MEPFHTDLPVIGMIHLLPLPGLPRFTHIQHVIERAHRDYDALRKGGVDAVLIENFGDAPYTKARVESHIVSWMTRIILSLSIDIPFGVNVLRNDPISALAICHATGGMFIRCNVFLGVTMTDQGIIEGKAFQVLQYRRVLSEEMKIFADVLVKHSYPLFPQLHERAARDLAYRGLADALIVTGTETGEEPHVQDLRAVKKAAPDKPLLAGSGVNAKNVDTMLEYADGCIVGTAFKKDNKTENPVESEKVREFMRRVEGMRQKPS